MIIRSRSQSQSQSQPSSKRSVMLQLELPTSDQRIQALKDQPQGEEEDRRRPGRADEVNPNLVPLLRGEAALNLLARYGMDPPLGLEYAKPRFGIAAGLAIGIPLWSVLCLVAWAILR